MGVNHLRQYASVASSKSSRGDTHNSPQSGQTSAGPNFKRPAETSGTTMVPQVGEVNSFDSKSVHPANSTQRPAETLGGRSGSKSGQEKTGDKSGNQKGMSGGRMS